MTTMAHEICQKWFAKLDRVRQLDIISDNPNSAIELELLKAVTNAFELEHTERTKYQKKTTQKKSKRRISFGDVKEFGEEKTKTMNFITKPKELISTPLLEKLPSTPSKNKYGILHVLLYEPMNQFIGGTSESLKKECELANISIDTLTNDLKMLYKKHFRKMKTAILGYRSCFKFKPFYGEIIWDNDFKIWLNTGKKLPVSKKLRMYLIQVIKDKEIAAISIQTAWRKKKSYNELKLRKK